MPTLTLARVAPAVSSAAPTAITSTSLKQRATAIKAEIAALVAARSCNALAALQGDTEAIAAVASIDASRAALSAELETVEAAIPEVQERERANPALSPRNLARLKHQLQLVVSERRENLIFNLTHGSLRDNRENEIVPAFAQIEPLAIARELVKASVKAEQIFWNHNASAAELEGARRKQSQADAERQRTIERLANDLVESTELPPLPDAIAKYDRKRQGAFR